MQEPQKLSKEEVQQQLFDGLMAHIEPKLMISARKETAAELAAMEPAERAEWMRYFLKAYEDFVTYWPKFLKGAMQEVGKIRTEIREVSREQDHEDLQGIERKIIDDSSPVAS
jgi:hypothetical protein